MNNKQLFSKTVTDPKSFFLKILILYIGVFNDLSNMFLL